MHGTCLPPTKRFIPPNSLDYNGMKGISKGSTSWSDSATPVVARKARRLTARCGWPSPVRLEAALELFRGRLIDQARAIIQCWHVEKRKRNGCLAEKISLKTFRPQLKALLPITAAVASVGCIS